jgi:eukaryotic-like serine/threonine-protein kinase
MPERLGRYRLVRPLSVGGMACVFEARRESLAGVSPRVALKVILPDFAADNAFQSLFVNEARIGSQLQHQNLVQIQDFDRDGSRFYIVMEYVDGITLRRITGICRQIGLSVPVDVVAELGRQAAEGLYYLHSAAAEDGTPLHLVHRDIKPSNLMLNGQGVVKVLDFGISKALFNREKAGTVKGTWGYMSPEQAQGGEVGPLADVFGLACVLYELAALEPLFPEKGASEIRDLLLKDEAARRASTLVGPYAVLVPTLIRALQRDPAARFASMQTFGRALLGLLSDPPSSQEHLVRFHHAMAEIQDEPRAGVGGPSLSPHAPPSKDSQGSAGARSGPRAHPPRGLPVSVGAAPPGLGLSAAAATPVSRSLLWRFRWPVLLAAIVLLGLLAGWWAQAKVGGAPNPGATAADRDEIPTGLLTIDSVPDAQIIVDGRLVSAIPLIRYAVSAGVHSITLVTDDERRYTFRVDVLAGQEVRRTWYFDRNAWAEP